ncbi:MAG: N-acetylmuramoyl-L-alanine amidase, partial [Cellulosilyticaceae bacterium]
MRYNVHAGHNPDGLVACGAEGLIKESTEARKVKDEVIRLLRAEGEIAYDCTVNDGYSQSDVLNKIINLSKRNEVDFEVSIHFNSGAEDKKGNGKTTGVEVLVYELGDEAEQKGKVICGEISSDMDLKNRGIKVRPDLAVLRRTKAPAMLVECCFVDDLDDVRTYNYKSMAKSIVKGLLGRELTSTQPIKPSNATRKYANGDYDRKARVVGTDGTGRDVFIRLMHGG